jgi:hypothetical protein
MRDPILGEDCPHCLCARRDDARPPHIQRDPQALRAGVLGDVAVSEVHAQEIRVARAGKRAEVVLWGPAARASLSRVRAPPRGVATAPVANGATRNPARAGYLAVVQPSSDQVDDLGMFSVGSAHRSAAGGTRTHKSLRTMPFESIAFAISPPPQVRTRISERLRPGTGPRRGNRPRRGPWGCPRPPRGRAARPRRSSPG